VCGWEISLLGHAVPGVGLPSPLRRRRGWGEGGEGRPEAKGLWRATFVGTQVVTLKGCFSRPNRLRQRALKGKGSGWILFRRPSNPEPRKGTPHH